MKLSTAAELAIKGMTEVAERYELGHVNIETICAARSLPRQYLSKIFNTLTKAGLVTPIRGKHGGYTLSRDPSKITLLQIIEAIEGPLAVNLCQHTPSQCSARDCNTRQVWKDIQRYVRQRLSATTLADCMAAQPATARK